jgi:hypothetical protein
MIENKVPLSIIRFTGVFDYPGVLRMIHKTCVDYHYEMYEKAYKHKVPNPYGEEDELAWYGLRKINWYLRARIELDFHTFGVKDIEIVKDGKKIKAQEGIFQLQIKYILEHDYQNQFQKSKFTQWMQKFYERFIAREYIDNVWDDQLHYHTYKLHRAIKEYLGMSTPTNASEGRW